MIKFWASPADREGVGPHHTPRGRPMWRRVGPCLALVALLAAGCASASGADARGGAAGDPVAAAPGPARPAPRPPCPVPAPRTAAGYRAALAALPSSEWGAADLSVSVPLPDGRTVWLYGDTLRGSGYPSGFLRSTAIVQDRGCLHVSAAGAPVLPDGLSRRFSWLASGIAIDRRHLLVATTQQVVTGTCPMCFRVVGQRGAVVTVTAAGDVRFDHWLPRWPAWTRRGTWGVAMIRVGSLVAMYGISVEGLTGTLYVATAGVADALRGDWHLGTRPLLAGVDPAGVSPFHDARGWHLLMLRGRQVVRADGASPSGPFTTTVLRTLAPTGPGQVRYLAAAHPELRLSGARMLVTVCRNWLDRRRHPVASYRPIYLAVPR